MPIIIVDYDAGNLKSITNILEKLDCKYKISSCPKEIENAKKIIFPGQGHFEQAMKNLQEKGLVEPIKKATANGASFLGICLGLQVLFETSEEAPGIKGLGIFEGEVKKFSKGKIPQIGWNKIIPTLNNSYLEPEYYYFVNSYYVEPKAENVVSSYCDYGLRFCASVEHENITAVQFHPEKSGEVGINFFKKWLSS